MLIYIIVWGVVIVCCVYEQFYNNNEALNSKYVNLSFWPCFSVLLVIGLLRSELLGVDMINYQSYFYDFAELSIGDFLVILWDQDIGYYLLGYLINRYVVNSFYIYKCILYIISFGFFGYFVYKKSKYPALSFLIYMGLGFLGYNFCLLRQAMAISLCLLAYMRWENFKFIESFILILVAVSFHKTAIAFLIIYIFSLKRFKELRIANCLSILLGAFVGFTVVLPFAASVYNNGLYVGLMERGQGGWLFLFYFVLYASLFYLIKSSKYISRDIYYVKIFNVACCALYFQAGALSFSLFTRIVTFFSVLCAFLIPSILEKREEKKILALYFGCMFSFLYFLALYQNHTDIVPYISIIDSL